MKLSVLVLATALLAVGAPFDLEVTRVMLGRDQRGHLLIDAKGVTFRSNDGKTIAIATDDLREANVADAHALRFETYEVRKWKPVGRRAYTFRARPDAPLEDLARFLAGRVHRPVVGHYSEDTQFHVAVYHKGVLKGTNGTLEIGQEAIRFVSEKPGDSRTWLYRDIETIGRPDSFRFRVTTNRETYVLELKGELSEAAYQLAWGKVYDRSLWSRLGKGR